MGRKKGGRVERKREGLSQPCNYVSGQTHISTHITSGLFIILNA